MQLRITKYNPIYRNALGHYKKDEWTSSSDIGKNFEDGMLMEEEYLRVESNYWQAYEQLLQQCAVPFMTVRDLSIHYFYKYKRCPSLTKNSLFLFENIMHVKENERISGYTLECLFKLALREGLWCRLQGPNSSYIHFGYDYYTYWGSCIDCDYSFIKKLGLFPEEYESPHMVTGWDEMDEDEKVKCLIVQNKQNSTNILKIEKLIRRDLHPWC